MSHRSSSRRSRAPGLGVRASTGWTPGAPGPSGPGSCAPRLYSGRLESCGPGSMRLLAGPHGSGWPPSAAGAGAVSGAGAASGTGSTAGAGSGAGTWHPPRALAPPPGSASSSGAGSRGWGRGLTARGRHFRSPGSRRVRRWLRDGHRLRQPAAGSVAGRGIPRPRLGWLRSRDRRSATGAAAAPADALARRLGCWSSVQQRLAPPPAAASAGAGAASAGAGASSGAGSPEPPSAGSPSSGSSSTGWSSTAVPGWLAPDRAWSPPDRRPACGRPACRQCAPRRPGWLALLRPPGQSSGHPGCSAPAAPGRAARCGPGGCSLSLAAVAVRLAVPVGPAFARVLGLPSAARPRVPAALGEVEAR